MRIIQRVQIGIGLATATAFEALILRPPGRQETDVAGLWAVTFIFGVGFFIFGRMYGAIAQENAQKLAAYLALSEEEKLIAKIEENMDRKKIGRLLDVASLTAARPSDGATPLIATSRYFPGHKNYQNWSRRYRVVFEISRRLPRDRFVAVINARDHKGWTALMYAAEPSDASGGALLIHYGADPILRNRDGLTAADIASRWPSTVEVFQGKTAPPAFPKRLENLERHWS